MGKFTFMIGFLALSLFSCTNYGQLTKIASLPDKLEENSGIITYGDSTIWLIEDNGNRDEIYQVNFKGDIIKSLKVKNGNNNDWEDLAKDAKGNAYIADIGNNNNTRKNLVVYKIPNPTTEPGDKIDAERIAFNYPDQTRFPPKDDSLFYDAEALFHQGNKLYIVTKNRSTPFNGKAHVYVVPDTPGTYEAKFIGSFTPCNDRKTCQITAMDISPSGKKIVVLSYGKLFVFSDFTWDNFSKGKIEEIDIEARTQLEAISFLNEKTLLISDERAHGSGGNLYTYTLN